MNKELNALKKEKFQQNGKISVVIFLLVALLSSMVVLISFVSSSALLLLVPFIVLPIMFAVQFALVAMRETNTMTFSLFSFGFRSYFNERFRSNFLVISTIVRCLILYLATALAITLFVILPMYYANALNLRDIVNQIMASMQDSEALDEIYKNNIQTFHYLSMITSLPTAFICSLYALFRLSINSHSIFLRFTNNQYSGAQFSEIHKTFYKNNRRSYLKDYFSLNWPLYLLYIVGFVGGMLIAIFLNMETSVMISFAISLGLFLSFGLFGAFYFANKEALHEHYEKELKQADRLVKIKILESLQERSDILDNEKEEIEKLLKEQLKEDLDNDSTDNKEDEK